VTDGDVSEQGGRRGRKEAIRHEGEEAAIDALSGRKRKDGKLVTVLLWHAAHFFLLLIFPYPGPLSGVEGGWGGLFQKCPVPPAAEEAWFSRRDAVGAVFHRLGP